MDREKVQKRLDQLEQERTNLFNNLNAYNGAIEDCKYWLSQFDKLEPEKKEE